MPASDQSRRMSISSIAFTTGTEALAERQGNLCAILPFASSAKAYPQGADRQWQVSASTSSPQRWFKNRFYGIKRRHPTAYSKSGHSPRKPRTTAAHKIDATVRVIRGEPVERIARIFGGTANRSAQTSPCERDAMDEAPIVAQAFGSPDNPGAQWRSSQVHLHGPGRPKPRPRGCARRLTQSRSAWSGLRVLSVR